MKGKVEYKFSPQSNYPEVYFPNGVISYFKNWKKTLLEYLSPPPIEKINFIKPKEPHKPAVFKEIIFGIGLAEIIRFVAFILSYFILSDSLKIIGFLLYLTCVIYYFTNHLYRKVNYPTLLKKFVLESEEYENQLNIFEKKQQNRKNQIEKIKENLNSTDSRWAEDERVKYLSNLLNRSEKARCEYENPQQGQLENIFLDVLKEYFKDEIYTDKVIEIFYNGRAYCPDFIFEHSKTGLTIDIEIDEPYTSDKPIHYLGSSHDYERNKYFLERGWVVIRFSEMQIQLEPKSCCREIAEVIFDLTKDFHYLKLLKDEPRLFRHNKWTERETKKLISENIRQDYSKLNLGSFDMPLKDILGLWKISYSYLYFLFKKDKSIIAYREQNEVRRGVFKFFKTNPTGKIILFIEWEKSKETFFVERCIKNSLILTSTPISDRLSYRFLRTKTMSRPQK